MKLHSTVFALCLAILTALPAAAQDRYENPHNKKAPITVESFSPAQGQVGTLVTIRGKGFSGKTRVLVGGRPVQPKQVRPQAIVFAVPDSHGDGQIVLRHPGVARDIEVGRFTVSATIRITRFAPLSGSPGTRVEIQGSGFHKGDRVLMNNKDVAVNRSAPNRLVITIPDDASPDYLTVVAADGSTVRTSEKFQVRMPAPTISGFSPQKGFPGTRVRISGTYLSGVDKVLYGKQVLEITSRTSGSLDVIIPAKARAGRPFVVAGANGQARSAQSFTLAKPASIKRIAPTSGKAGTTVRITGAGFAAGDRVTLGNVEVEVLLLRPNQIAVRIPEGAHSGPLVVERGAMRVTSPRFNVEAAPVITGFIPAGGKAGVKVTISGQHFSRDAIVFYGTQKLRVLQRKQDDMLVVRIPKKATDQVFRVRTRAGQAISAQPYRVHVVPVVKSVEPGRGAPGTRVTLRGAHMKHVDAVSLDDIALAIVSRSPVEVVVEIPLGARDGRFKVKSFETWNTSKLVFDVLDGPAITSFTPQAGPPGTELVIEGTGFTPETTVFFGTVKLAVTRRQENRLVARVPAATRPSAHYLRARNGLSETRSPVQFEVTAPAVITGFTPERAQAGGTVVIRGKNFNITTKVLWGDTVLPVLRVGPAGQSLVVKIPKLVVGARYLMVDDGGMRSRSAAMLEVLTPRPRRK